MGLSECVCHNIKRERGAETLCGYGERGEGKREGGRKKGKGRQREKKGREKGIEKEKEKKRRSGIK